MMIDRAVYKGCRSIDTTNFPKIPTWAQFKVWNNMLYRMPVAKLSALGTIRYPNGTRLRGRLRFPGVRCQQNQAGHQFARIGRSADRVVELTARRHLKYEDIAAIQSGTPGNQYGAWMAGIRGMEEDDYWMFLAIDKYAPKMDYFVNYLPTMNGKEESKKATLVGCGIWPSPRAELSVRSLGLY